MNREIKIEIVTPVHNRRDTTLRCLKSLHRITGENLRTHIIIVDDGSTDGTSEAIKGYFPDVEIVAGNGELWFTEGTNVGIRAALKHQPDYILTINDDSVFDADFLNWLVKTAEKFPSSVVGPLLLLWDEPHKLFQTAPVFDVWSGGWRHWHQQTVWTVPKNAFSVDLIVGNCVLFPAEVFEKQGLMNSKRYPNFGDSEYTPRLKKNGWHLLIEPRARVFCQPNYLPAKISKMSIFQKFDTLFVNLHHIHNLRRRFYANWDSAPTRFKGLAAYFIFLFRIFLKRNVEKLNWTELQKEKPLADVFASSIVNE